jgi:hypothetical protein
MSDLDLGPATHALAELFAGIGDDQLGAPTPCDARPRSRPSPRPSRSRRTRPGWGRTGARASPRTCHHWLTPGTPTRPGRA